MHVNWSAAWIGALGSLAAALILGLFAAALGTTWTRTIASWHTIRIGELFAVVLIGFFAFAIGGWSAGKVAAFRHAEPSILHAVMGWLIALPMLLAAVAFGAGGAYGSWYGGLITSPFVAAAAPVAPDAVRNDALAAVTALLVALIGAVIGGWIASGEPMTLTHHRSRRATYYVPPGGGVYE
jgi:hypothetical protein